MKKKNKENELINNEVQEGKITKNKKKKSKKQRTLNYEAVALNERFILSLFILFAIIVCIVGCFVVKDRNNNRVIDNTDLVLPILEADKKKVLKLDAFELTMDRFYIIKVVNYNEEKLIEEDLVYSIDIENETKATIKLTKNEDLTNLIKNNKKTFINGQELKKDKKQEDIYYLSVVHDGGVIKGDKIKITFNSTN